MDVITTIAVGGACFIGGAIAGGYMVSKKLSDEFAKWRVSFEEENTLLHEERNRFKAKLEDTIERYSKESESNDTLREIKEKADKVSKEYNDVDFNEHFGAREYPEEDREFYPPPFQISEDELEVYADSELTELSYYQGDQTLLDDIGERIRNPEAILGEQVAEALLYTEDTLIYVHNAAQDTNYEVHVYYGDSVY